MTTFAFTTVDRAWMKTSVASKRRNLVALCLFAFVIAYFRQITLSQLYFCASIRSVGSMVPPRRPGKQTRVSQRWKSSTYVRPNGVYFLSECCNRRVYDHLKGEEKWTGWDVKVWIYLRVVCQQKSSVADRVEYPPYLEFLP